MRQLLYLVIGVFFGIVMMKSEAASWYRGENLPMLNGLLGSYDVGDVDRGDAGDGG